MKNPTKVFLATVAVFLLTCSVFSEQARAIPITGGVSYAGSYTTNTGNLNTATAFTSFTGVAVVSGSGSYAGTAGTSMMMNPFSFNPFVGSAPLWTFMFGGRTYSFDLLTLTQRIQPGDGTLTLSGAGILRISGVGPTFDPTFGTFRFTANQSGGGFFFVDGGGGPVPDEGSALALLAIGLVGVEALRRKLAVA